MEDCDNTASEEWTLCLAQSVSRDEFAYQHTRGLAAEVTIRVHPTRHPGTSPRDPQKGPASRSDQTGVFLGQCKSAGRGVARPSSTSRRGPS